MAGSNRSKMEAVLKKLHTEHMAGVAAIRKKHQPDGARLDGPANAEIRALERQNLTKAAAIRKKYGFD